MFGSSSKGRLPRSAPLLSRLRPVGCDTASHRKSGSDNLAKIPSKNFATAKRKIPSRKFPKSKRKIPSRPFAKQTAKIPSRKFSEVTAAANKQPDVASPAKKMARRDRHAGMTGKSESCLPPGAAETSPRSSRPIAVQSAVLSSSRSNLFTDIPQHLTDELCTLLLAGARVRVERIVSHGHASPEGFWYDQDQPEWVVLLKGAARLRFEEESVDMLPGNFIDIPAHRKHRVEWTTPDEPTIWLAIHYEQQTA